GEDLAHDRGDDRHDHDRDDDASGHQHPAALRHAEDRLQDGYAIHPPVDPLVGGEEPRSQHEDAPQAEHHRGNGGEQVDDRDHVAAQPYRGEFGEEQRDADGDRDRDQQAQQRDDERAVDEGERAELRRLGTVRPVRVVRDPGLAGEEVQPLLLEDRDRLLHRGDEDERQDDQDEQAGDEREPGERPVGGFATALLGQAGGSG